MRIAILLATLMAIAAPGQAQADPTNPTLDILAPMMGGEDDAIPIHHAGTLLVPWTYTFPHAGAAAAALALGNTSIAWTLGCAEGQVSLIGAPTTNIQFTAGTTAYEGTAQLPLQASADTPGLRDLACRIEGVAGGSVQTLQSTDANDFAMPVAWNGDVTFSTPAARQAGPQKQIAYPVEVTNAGNSRVIVRWEITEKPSGKWVVLAPDALTLDPGMTVTAIITAATPFDNGYNKGSETLHVRAIVTPVDAEEVLQSKDLKLGATVRGWYVPGPSLVAVLAALGAAVLLTRRLA